jgi:hypothetical protein
MGVLLGDEGPHQPLDVMMRTMRGLFDAGRLKEAADVAKAAAPYIHPRASARTGAGGMATLRDHDLDRLAEGDCDGARAEEQDTDPA